VPPPFSSCSDSDFVRVVSRKFDHGRFLIIGANPHTLVSQFAKANREAEVWSYDDLVSKLSQDGGESRFETVIWLYPSRTKEDERLAEALSHRADRIVLVPGPGADASARRPELIQDFGRFGVVPDYECDLIDLDPAAVCLRRLPAKAAGELVSAVEVAFARINRQLAALRRVTEARGSELEEAHRHIAALEEKLLKLKQYRRELKLLREQRQTLRKSAERRIGQILLAPYRVPEKLVKAFWRTFHRDSRRPSGSTAASEYQKWFEHHRASAERLKQMRNEARMLATQPLISVITPVFDTPVQHLEEAVESVLAQAYENWELLFIDDGSTDSDLLRMLPSIATRDRRIVRASPAKHGGISAALNRGLALARGEWVAFLDHDDILEPDALFQIVKLLQTHPDADLIYSDEDKLGEDGFEAPLFKPDWSPDFFLSYNYLGHLTAIRRALVQEAGGFGSQFDGAQDYDLFFRVIEQTNQIHHIPRVLYHWRRTESSSAISVRQKPGQLEASRLAIEDHLKRRGERVDVAVDWRTHAFRVRRELLEPSKISIIVPSYHGPNLLERCLESLISKTSYPNYEIVVVRTGDKSSGATVCCSRIPHRLLNFSDVASGSAAKNYAVAQTDSSWLLFLDDSVEAIAPDWLTIMAEHVQRPEVGAVGPRLLNLGGTVEHAGIVVGINGTAQMAFRGLPAEHPGANRQLQVTRNCTAVSSACMLTRRQSFQEAGGFEENLSGVLADVDLCLKLRRAGHLIVYTPFAKLYWHATQIETIDPSEDHIMRERWAGALQHDPYYNSNLSRERADFSLGK
jgi:glycosyltransferase involved in cell wall biosynthesis